MATSSFEEDSHKYDVLKITSENLPQWVSTWTAFVNKLHGRSFIVSCADEECGADIQLTRDNVHQDGVTIHCAECGDFARHWPEEWVHGLRAQGVDLDE